MELSDERGYEDMRTPYERKKWDDDFDRDFARVRKMIVIGWCVGLAVILAVLGLATYVVVKLVLRDRPPHEYLHTRRRDERSY